MAKISAGPHIANTKTPPSTGGGFVSENVQQLATFEQLNQNEFTLKPPLTGLTENRWVVLRDSSNDRPRVELQKVQDQGGAKLVFRTVNDGRSTNGNPIVKYSRAIPSSGSSETQPSW
jgi:hypothetical protein